MLNEIHLIASNSKINEANKLINNTEIFDSNNDLDIENYAKLTE